MFAGGSGGADCDGAGGVKGGMGECGDGGCSGGVEVVNNGA